MVISPNLSRQNHAIDGYFLFTNLAKSSYNIKILEFKDSYLTDLDMISTSYQNLFKGGLK